MAEMQTNLEIIAPTVEEAIAKGLSDLGLTDDQVDVEVLDAGSKGLFGIGTRQARVRLTIRTVSAAPAVPIQTETEEELEAEEVVEVKDVQPRAVSKLEDDQNALQIATATVEELLEKMSVIADVSAEYREPDDEQSKRALWIEITGNDLSILIGPRAETLNALQHVTSLIVARELGHSVPMVVDVENYRKRRVQQLRQLARRMADQALKTGRRQVLEPMPANERRVIHIELKKNPEVISESIGEEPYRKVTIQPK